MSTDRICAPILVALAALSSLTTAASAQQPVARRTALEVLTSHLSAQADAQSPQSTAQQQTTDDEPEPAPPGADELPDVPDRDQRPGEPPPLIDDGEPDLDDVEEGQQELGTFFLTTFAFASAYDELRSDTLVTPSPLAPGGPEDTTIDDEGEIAYLFRPTFLYVHKPNSRTSLVAAYGPEIEQVQDEGDEERVSHSAGLVWDRRMTRRTDLTAGASYLDSLDPTRHLGGEGFVLIPGRFEQLRGYFGASHLWPRATRLHFYTEYAQAETDLEQGSPALDVTDLSGTLALEQGIGRRSEFTLSYSYTDTETETIDSVTAAPERFSGPVDAVRAGFGHRFGAFSLHFSGGALREQPLDGEVDGEDDTTWIGSAEVARETQKILMRLRYDHSLFAFGYGDAAIPGGIDGPLTDGAVLRDTEADTLSFFLELLPHNRVRLEQSLWLSRESVIAGDELESFVTGTLLEVLLTGRNVHRLILFSRFDYFDRDESDLLGEALSRTRFSLGFRVGLTGPHTKVGQRLAIGELRRVLPSGGRL